MIIKRLSEHFLNSEFICKHCEMLPGEGIDMQLVYYLEILRHKLGDNPIRIISGYRCEAYNTKINGAKFSQHMLGKAADITIDNVSIIHIMAAANLLFYADGVGRYDSFIHVDTRGTRTRW